MKYFTNGWNWVFLLLGYGFPVFFSGFFKSVNPAFFVFGIIILALIKETLDTVAKSLNSSFMYKLGFDPAGFDLRDIVMCIIGTLISLLTLSRLS